MTSRDLIRHILLEETSEDDRIKKGIDIAVKFLSKDYPFVVGWDYAAPIEKWAYTIYIDIEVDHEKAFEFFNVGPHPRFYRFLQDTIERRDRMAYPFSLSNYEDIEGFNKDVFYEIKNDLIDIYEDMVPERFKMKKRTENRFVDPDETKELSIDNYINVK